MSNMTLKEELWVIIQSNTALDLLWASVRRSEIDGSDIFIESKDTVTVWVTKTGEKAED